jgi:tetratricopeptide (TPR) repeat protein
MFIIIPISFLVASILGILFIIGKKMPYLRKLSPESHEIGDTIFHDLFPEIDRGLKSIDWKQYRKSLLKEVEKFLRRLKLFSLKIDYISDSLIKKIRKIHITDHIAQETMPQNTLETLNSEAASSFKSPLDELKDREQQLIIEIAKNPKDPVLYETLGDLYIKMNNKNEAKESYEAALSFNPDNKVIVQKYSQLIKDLESEPMVR